MSTHVVLWLVLGVLGVAAGAGWVKVANFFDGTVPGHHTTYVEYGMTAQDLVVLVVDTVS